MIINSWIFLEFYETFNSLKTKLNNETPEKYNTTNDFLRKLKMVMAKLAVGIGVTQIYQSTVYRKNFCIENVLCIDKICLYR